MRIMQTVLDEVGASAPETPTAQPRTPEALLRALAAHGITLRHDANDALRDAAHEAAHALAWGLKPPWTRARVAKAAPRRVLAKFQGELLARAVEQLVCEAVGAPCAELEVRASTAGREAMKYDGYNAPHDAFVAGIKRYLELAEARALAAQILALPEVPRV